MNQIPAWSLIPFALVILSVAILPNLAPRFWKKFHFLWLATLAMPIVAMSAALDYSLVIESFVDYVSFISLLATLYSIGGGLLISGMGKANPISNTTYMVIGALLSNCIGTLGASMLLIRPLLRSNRGRKHEVHIILFFIFIVSNCGGLLTPLGDPPLLLGFLNGVPFWWTLKLLPIWLFVLTALVGVFVAVDSYYFLEDPDFRGPTTMEVKEPLHITGRWNLALIPLVVLALILPSHLPKEFELWHAVLRVGMLLIITYASRKLTPALVTKLNNFSWEPLREVAIMFLAIFATMIPATAFLRDHAASFSLQSPKAFYWLSGIVSAFVDNAPAYQTFFSVAQGLGKDASTIILGHGKMISETLLSAISCGTVFFGALTYIGNGPNLLVKAIAEENNIKTPSFFSYILWSVVYLVPILFLTSVIFFE
jgi:Na+/H+ antiporter NhaD/arsenite permease-like protein